MVKVDPNELESALPNLNVNARDPMPAGGKPTIETPINTLMRRTLSRPEAGNAITMTIAAV